MRSKNKDNAKQRRNILQKNILFSLALHSIFRTHRKEKTLLIFKD